MEIPKYWAQTKEKRVVEGRSWTIRRWGWSSSSKSEAEKHAQERLEQAFAEVEAGKQVHRLENKVAYQADGIPIREEIVKELRENIITRNSYGVLCLNSPDVLFADIDFPTELGCLWTLAIFAGLNTVGIPLLGVSLAKVALAIFLAAIITSILLTYFFNPIVNRQGKTKAYKRVKQFIQNNPDWHLRVYQTPAGLRLLAMHKTFDPRSDETTSFLKKIKSDPLYANLCKNQRCFRARLTAKPWRVGVRTQISYTLWPIEDLEKLRKRNTWIDNYETKSKNFAACKFIESLGSNLTVRETEYVKSVHDDYCRANQDLPIA